MRDVEARETLLDSCFGAERFQKTCERLREGRVPARGLSLVIERDGSLIGTVRLWHVSAGANRPALMLGPIAIDPSCQGLGLGAKLMREALSRSKALSHKAIVLVGDAPYYERFGFSADSIAGLNRLEAKFTRMLSVNASAKVAVAPPPLPARPKAAAANIANSKARATCMPAIVRATPRRVRTRSANGAIATFGAAPAAI
jgi:predicted N-acetyltransferase YhbS